MAWMEICWQQQSVASTYIWTSEHKVIFTRVFSRAHLLGINIVVLMNFFHIILKKLSSWRILIIIITGLYCNLSRLTCITAVDNHWFY